jgi:uncharacterized OsmC-like protein
MEKVIVRMNRDFQVEFSAVRPQDENGEFQPVSGLHELTPYGLMLTGLATCTAQVVLSYARNHGVALARVDLREEYARSFKDDCEDCEGIDRYDERIEEYIHFGGDLSGEEREKLFHIAHQCSIHKMYEAGIEIRSQRDVELPA